MKDRAFRQALVELLLGAHAHADARTILSGVRPQNRARRPPGLHSVWDELEHLRIAQEDILKYTLDASWESPRFPDGYWPKPTESVGDGAFEESTRRFLADLDAVAALAADGNRDLTALVPHGEGRTYLRQVLLVADHNAYHLGQIVAVRKLLGDWNPAS